MNETMNFDNNKTVIGGAPASDATQMVSAPGVDATQYAANVNCPVCHTPNPPSETYCMDCGFMLASAPVDIADMPKPEPTGKLVSSDGTLDFPLKKGENAIGREGADVLLSNSTVSRKHGKIVYEANGVFVEDLGSTNGTLVDGVKVQPGQRVEIKDGSEVTIGSVVLKYVAPEEIEALSVSGKGFPETTETTEIEPEISESDSEVADTPEIESVEDTLQVGIPGGIEDGEAAIDSGLRTQDSGLPTDDSGLPTEDSAPSPVGRLVAKDGGMAFDLFEGVNTIGRRQGENLIVISDPYCSGRHANLSVEDGVFTITDVGSTNGTFVNGVRLEENVSKQIQPGDEITLGTPVFKLEVV